MNRTSKSAGGLLLLAALLACQGAAAYQANITADSRALYLRVGTGAMNFDGFSYNQGARPINFTGVQNVVVNVPVGQIGNGTDLQMTGNGDLVSHLDNFLFCNPGQIYIGAFFRRPTGGGGNNTATVTANYSPNLTTPGGDTIPMTQIRWVSSGNGDGTFQPFASGSFTTSGQTVATFGRNQWNESCLTFFYGNDQVVAAGSYTNTVTYTLTAP
ncbi:MAG TPA: hypothetical protein VFQ84_08605 [Arenimonas sp.]|uniref:hypothetical protein n=1 Tax=Arenimonas sp. TaxID=1872635 RepID=UPI002D7F8202|nr:hypothetical protein [Arenimonas sp.]HEU0153389.1 hypothetical protein [Arenimonas sp.]